MQKLLAFSLFCFAILTSHAQSIHKFERGFVVPQSHKYGREAMFLDKVAYALHSGKFIRPAKDSILLQGQENIDLKWKDIGVDSTGKFRGEELANGYLYLTYESDRNRDALLNVSGNVMCYFNGAPHTGDIYGDGWMKIPVKIKKGQNEVLIRCGTFSRWLGVTASLTFDEKPIFINREDLTLPHIIVGEPMSNLYGAVVITNNTDRPITNAIITAVISGKHKQVYIPEIKPRSIRKVAFEFDPSLVSTRGDYDCVLKLFVKNKLVDEKTITITAVTKDEHHSYTFISTIDGSVQYYSVAPQSGNSDGQPAMFFSVHGAGVEAIGQARAYKPKEWGVTVAPTNRRPRGFNWEDWGRLDALEVLELAKKRYNPDPARIYLTGHSMGGHGTWFLGATYPEKWAAIAPCAGYPSLMVYGSADGKIPRLASSPQEEILLRAANPSNVLDLAKNYKGLGVYVHHGDSDKVVSVDYARQMREVLATFHTDFAYYEYPGGSHWFGNESVDWPPLFDFFKSHRNLPDTAVDVIDFIVTNPAISSTHRWASVIQQNRALSFSSIHLNRNKRSKRITGNTENVATLQLDLDVFDEGDTIQLVVDSVEISHVVSSASRIYLTGYPHWRAQTEIDSREKNPVRYGTFKEAFNHRMVFVFGTKGNQQENEWAYNKARYDAEVWYYRGNGSVDLVADVIFRPENFKDRGIIIYGNVETNSAWNKMLRGCPIRVTRDEIKLGPTSYKGTDLAAYFAWPRHDSDTAMVGVVTGTGLQGMHAAESNQYFAAGSGFPDFLIFSADMLKDGASGIKAAGFYSNRWTLMDSSQGQ